MIKIIHIFHHELVITLKCGVRINSMTKKRNEDKNNFKKTKKKKQKLFNAIINI